MGADAGFLGRLGPELLRLLPMLDERSRRLALGMAAAAAGEGGTAAVAALAGASWQTVADGKAELESGEGAAAGRVRRPGGGRKLLEDADPGLLPALESLIRDAIRGDPMTPLLWTTRSLGHLSGELTAAGHPCSPGGLRLVMRRAGYTLQSNARAQEGRCGRAARARAGARQGGLTGQAACRAAGAGSRLRIISAAKPATIAIQPAATNATA